MRLTIKPGDHLRRYFFVKTLFWPLAGWVVLVSYGVGGFALLGFNVLDSLAPIEGG